MVRSETLESYFFEKVQDASLDGDVKAYLVMTLARWAVSEPDTQNSLAIEYMNALHQGGWKYREIGDKALYLSSVRSRHYRRPVPIGYYEDVGTASYAKFAEHTKSRSFWELAQCFSEASEVIYHVFHTTDPATLIQRAQESGDERDEHRLSQMGIYLLK